MTMLAIPSPIRAPIVGILIVPWVPNYVVAAYLIPIALIGLFPHVFG